MKRILVVAPHPDDETLGCAGTLLRHVAAGDRWYWLLMTDASASDRYSPAQVSKEREQIQNVERALSCSGRTQLKNAPASLDHQPLAELVAQVSDVVRTVEPEVIYVPYPGDSHSDHAVTFDAAVACTKWFRFP